MKRIKHNDLTHYFLRDHKDLPRAYLDSCEKFFKACADQKRIKWEASSTKQQALRKIKEDNDFLDKQSNAEYYDSK
jgi:hypothetical protein